MDKKPTYQDLEDQIRQLEQESHHRLRAEMINQAMFKIANAVNSTSDLNELYRSIHQTLSTVIDTTNFYIALYDQACDGITFAYCVDKMDGSYLPRVGVSQTASLTGDIIRTRKPAMLTKTEIAAWRIRSGLTVPSCSLSEIWLGAPLLVQQKIIGVMAVQSYTDPALYDQTDMDVMTAVADQVAIAIESKWAADALQESEHRFRELAELLPETIFETDTDGNILFANKNGIDQFGYNQEDLENGLNAFDLLAAEDRQRAGANFARVLAGESIGLSEYRACRKKGTLFPVMLLSTAIIHDGEAIGLRGFIINLTEKKRLEGQLQHSQKMEAIGTLAGGIAHDFNNILAAIMGYAEMTLMDSAEDSLIYYNASQILKASLRAKDLVEQILSFSRQKDLKKTPLQVGPIITEAVKLLRATLPTTIAIQTDIAEKIGIVDADPTQIHQIMMNLGANAGQAIGEKGGAMVIRLNEVQLDAAEGKIYPDLYPGRYLVLSVSDTGTGIPKKIQPRIFEPFFTTKGDGTGTGMGLAVVHGIVKSHDGAIMLQNSGAQGSTFVVYLPIIPYQHPEEDKHAPDIATGTESILLVDDERLLTDMGAQMLERLGYRVTATVSSVEALEIFKQQPGDYDLVMTDMTMPHLTGDILARKLIAVRPDIPIIICTGFNENLTPAKSKSIGIKAFLMKPLEIQELATTIRRVLDG